MTGYFDGASRGNPGDAGAGAWLDGGDGSAVWETASYLGRKTNNEAEYNAAILLLKAARERGVTRLTVRGDSKLVVSQLSKQWKINLPHLRELAQEAWRGRGHGVTRERIPRERDTSAPDSFCLCPIEAPCDFIFFAFLI